MDPLSAFFERIQLKGSLFYAGRVDGVLDIDKPEGTAFLHILEQGGIDLVRAGHPSIPVDRPALLLCPGSCRYRLRNSAAGGAPIICATYQLGPAIGRTLPFGVTDTIVFPFEEVAEVLPVIRLLLEEFRGDAAGRSKGINALFEYILILLVRQAIARQAISAGVLCAIADAHIGRALKAIHERPEEPWTVEQLAALAGMSRSRFAARFSALLGVAPIAYLASWRLRRAQELMRDGVALKVVASSAGFSSQPTFTRAFSNEMGVSPGEWLRLQRPGR
ncbi:helix-turn-helix transcriptional regulator [Herbaspirillum robiniae]|uniref:Helix-turn-helix transcriptional regulator n=1 Tax=Herbaspirillum robiniae TaxID=2014887 RepID=A0ABX2M3W5_9BURK|nr:AraC family transcriptional regulator [Herbaspirillum robiniae]NUU04060.1 helix-turn-helix transcriptional regulator [Herbaspirillum robiniae]